MTDAACDAALPADAGACRRLGHDESRCMSLRMGSGRDGTLDGYRDFESGQTVWITPGPQGLQHVNVALRASGLDPRRPLIEMRLVREADCADYGSVRLRLPFLSVAGANEYGLPNLRVQVGADERPLSYCDLLGERVVMVGLVDDGAGHFARREMALRVGGIDPQVPDATRRAWQEACTGRGLDGGADGGVTDAQTTLEAGASVAD